MTKAKIQAIIQTINKINLENRKKPEVAKAASQEALQDFIDDAGYTKEELQDKLQAKLEDAPTSTYLITMIEMLNQYV